MELAATNENFRDCLSLTTLQHADKQNPACASELFATWQIVTEAGFLGAGAYFKAAYLLLAAFYDKSLGPQKYITRQGVFINLFGNSVVWQSTVSARLRHG